MNEQDTNPGFTLVYFIYNIYRSYRRKKVYDFSQRILNSKTTAQLRPTCWWQPAQRPQGEEVLGPALGMAGWIPVWAAAEVGRHSAAQLAGWIAPWLGHSWQQHTFVLAVLSLLVIGWVCWLSLSNQTISLVWFALISQNALDSLRIKGTANLQEPQLCGMTHMGR